MEDVKWSPEMEVALYKAMVDHKPVGCNKHWHMLCIQYHIVTQGGVVISISAIWEHLKLLYDLASLDEANFNSFTIEEQEFELPMSFFDQGQENEESSRKRGRNSSSPSPSISPLPSSKRKKLQ